MVSLMKSTNLPLSVSMVTGLLKIIKDSPELYPLNMANPLHPPTPYVSICRSYTSHIYPRRSRFFMIFLFCSLATYIVKHSWGFQSIGLPSHHPWIFPAIGMGPPWPWWPPLGRKRRPWPSWPGACRRCRGRSVGAWNLRCFMAFHGV